MIPTTFFLSCENNTTIHNDNDHKYDDLEFSQHTSSNRSDNVTYSDIVTKKELTRKVKMIILNK